MSFTFRYYQPSDYDGLMELVLRSYQWEKPIVGLSRLEFASGLHPAFTGQRRAWERSVGVYRENDAIIAAVWNEGCLDGESFLLFDSPERPQDAALLADMIRFAKTNGSAVTEDRHIKRARLFAPEWNAPLRKALLSAGFSKTGDNERLNILPFPDEPFAARLPKGYAFADGRTTPDFYLSNTHRFAFGYGSEDTACKQGEQAFHELRQRGHYRPELDLCVLDPMGRPVAIAILWYDERMPYCELEPLGVAWWERRQGLATAILHEGANRVRRMFPQCKGMLGGDQPFYTALGYRCEATIPAYEWEKAVYISWEKESADRYYAREL